MGSAAKILIPVGIGIAAIATGGFGLLGAPAAAGAAGAAGAATTGAALTPAMAGVAIEGGSLTAATLGAGAAAAPAAVLTPAAAGVAVEGGSLTAATMGGQAAQPSLWTKFLTTTGLTKKEAIGLSLSGGSSIWNSANTAAAASAAEKRAALEASLTERQGLIDDIEAERELIRAIGTQTALAAAGGADPGSGSSLAVIEGLEARGAEMARLREQGAGYSQALSLLERRQLRRQRSLAPVAGLLGFAGDVGSTMYRRV